MAKRQANQTRKKKQTRKRGGSNSNQYKSVLIGQGLFGKVYRPPLKSADYGYEQFYTNDYVSKLTNTSAAEKEWQLTRSVFEFDPNSEYTIVPIKTYLSESNKPLLIMKYGGISLEKYLAHVGSSRPVASRSSRRQFQIIDSLVKLARFILSMNQHGIFHNDIQFDNIVYYDKSNRSRLIDFERSSHVQTGNDLYDIIAISFELYDQMGQAYGVNSSTGKSLTKRKYYTTSDFLADLEVLREIASS